MKAFIQSTISLSIKNSGLIIFAFLILGILIQPLALFFNHFITALIMAIIALSCLKIDYGRLHGELKNWPYHVYLVILSLLIIPPIIYMFAMLLIHLVPFMHHDFAIGALMLSATACAASSPAMALIYNTHFERAAFHLLTSSLLMIATLPWLIKLLAHEHIHLSIVHMLLSIAFVIIPSIAVGTITKLLFKKASKAIEPHVPFCSLCLLALLVLGCPSGIDHYFKHNLIQVILTFIMISLCLSLTFFLAWWLAFKKHPKEKLSTALLCLWVNFGLTLVLCKQWFGSSRPDITFYINLSVIVICLFPMVLNLFLKFRPIPKQPPTK